MFSAQAIFALYRRVFVLTESLQLNEFLLFIDDFWEMIEIVICVLFGWD